MRGLQQPWNCDKCPLTSQQEELTSSPMNHEAWTASPSGEPTLDNSFTEAETFPSSWEMRSQGCVQFDLEKYKNLRFLH